MSKQVFKGAVLVDDDGKYGRAVRRIDSLDECKAVAADFDFAKGWVKIIYGGRDGRLKLRNTNIFKTRSSLIGQLARLR